MATDELLAEQDRERESSDEPEESDASEAGRLSRLRPNISSPFSLRVFLLAVLLMFLGSAAAGLVPFVPATVATLVGVFVGAFALGLGRGTRSYLEVSVAGAGTAVVAALTQFLLLSVVGNLGVPVAAAGAGAGLGAAVVGHYLGRDLRDGLTRDL